MTNKSSCGYKQLFNFAKRNMTETVNALRNFAQRINNQEKGATMADNSSRNIVQAFNNTQLSIPGDGRPEKPWEDWVDIPGLQLNINSQSASSDFIVKGMIAGASTNGAYIRLLRNGKPVFNPDGPEYIAFFSNRLDDATSLSSVVAPVSFEIIDSPNIQGNITYTLQIVTWNAPNSVIYLNSISTLENPGFNGPFISNLIAEEIVR